MSAQKNDTQAIDPTTPAKKTSGTNPAESRVIATMNREEFLEYELLKEKTYAAELVAMIHRRQLAEVESRLADAKVKARDFMLELGDRHKVDFSKNARLTVNEKGEIVEVPNGTPATSGR